MQALFAFWGDRIVSLELRDMHIAYTVVLPPKCNSLLKDLEELFIKQNENIK